MHWFKTFIFWLLLGFILPAFGQENQLIEEAVKKNEQISKIIAESAEKLDLWLAGERQSYETNRTQVRLRSIVTDTESTGIVWDPYIDLDLHLPQLEERWQIFFSNYDRLEHQRESFKNPNGQSNVEQNTFVGLQFWKKLGDFNIGYQPQIKLGSKLQTKYTLKAENGFEIDDKRHANIGLHLFGDSDKGVGQLLSTSFDQMIAKYWRYYVAFQEEYFDAENHFLFSSQLGLIYSMPKRKTISLVQTKTSTNRPSYHLSSYSTRISWRHEPIKRVFQYGVTPFIQFLKQDHFKGDVGITLDIAIIF